MNNQTIVIAICSILGGCAVEDDGFATTDDEVVSQNALSNNALANNALTNNALANNALANNALANNGLVSATAVKNELCSTNGNSRNLTRAFFSYMVGCALPAGTTIQVQCTNLPTASFTGSLGLAPSWASATPTLADKELVSSCIAARVNSKGNTIHLSIRGPSSALAAPSTEVATYDTAEGAFYGNLFQTTPGVWSCGAQSTHVGDQIGRGCAWGGCAPLSGLGSCNSSCSSLPPGGYYGACDDNTGKVWTRPVTVYLTDAQPTPG